MSGIINSAGSKSGVIMAHNLGVSISGSSPYNSRKPSWSVNGAASTASTAWPPAPQNLDAVTGNLFVNDGITLNSSSNYITVTYAGTYWIFLDTRHDVGGGAANASENIGHLYIKEGAYVSSGNYTRAFGLTGTGGTRSDNNGALRNTSGVIINLIAGSHIWPGAYTSPTGGTSGVSHFEGVLIT